MTRKQKWLLGLIILVAIFFRFYLIGKMPGGLFPDEAANGLDINNIFKGHLQPFFPRGNGREALFFYFEALSAAIFGRDPWQFHIVSATIGVLSVYAAYLFGSRLYDRSTGLLASFLMAVGTWHVVLSRTALRAIQIPLFISLTFYFLIRTVQAQSKREQIWSAIFAGAFFAGGFYTYIAYRIMVVILGFIIGVLLLADAKQQWIWTKKYWRAFLTACASALVVFAPLGYYFLKHPGSFIGRAGQVSVFNTDLNHGHLLATFGSVVFESLRAFFIDGDLNWRQNVSGQPMLSPLYSWAFGIALVTLTVLAIRFIILAFRNKQNNDHLKHLLIITAFFGMLIPEITTAEGIPHGLRSIGTMVPAYLISAVGLIWFARAVMKFWHREWMEKLYVGVAVLFCAALVLITYSQYFVYAYNNPDNFAAFRSDLTAVSSYINSHPDAMHTYLVLDLYSLQSVDYMTTQTGNPYLVVDPASSDKLHLQTGDKVIFTASTVPDMFRFMQAHKNVEFAGQLTDKFGGIEMAQLNVVANDSSVSVARNSDNSMRIINFGDRVDWAWTNQSFDPWEIKIWLCDSATCDKKVLIKDNEQNDFLSNNDYQLMPGTKSDLYFDAIGYNAAGAVIKDFGITRVERYK